MKHLKKFESVNTTFTIYTLHGRQHSSTTMGLYIDDKLELTGEYGDSIYPRIDAFILGAKWSGVNFEVKYIELEDYELGVDLIYEIGIPNSLEVLESMINAKNMGLL